MAAPANTPQQPIEDNNLEADDGDSAFGTDHSDTTSIASSIYKGYVENGRRYQVTREGEYWGPSDEKQWEAMQAAHLVYLILDSKEENPLFRSPIGEKAQHILDIGTGNGAWAIETADQFPNLLVKGVDLYPPPETWVPPNCVFEVDDVLKTWIHEHKYDLVHLRDMYGSFTDKQWTGVYKQAYENLVPGGWIEEVETSVGAYCDDGTMSPDSLLAKSGPMFLETAEEMGKPLDAIDKCRSRIEAAGFINVHEKVYKAPLGEWAKNPIYKEAGRYTKSQLLEGLEGYCMFLLTKFGLPQPWSVDEVQVYLAKLREDIERKGVHAYYLKRRVWAQKPFDLGKDGESSVEVENVA